MSSMTWVVAFNLAYALGYVVGAHASHPNPWWVMLGAALVWTVVWAFARRRLSRTSTSNEGGQHARH